MLQPATNICKHIIRHKSISIKPSGDTLTKMINDYNAIAMQQKKKLKSFKMNEGAQLKVIGSGAPGVPAALYVITDHVNYLFNCGEGTQRLSQEYHCKLSKTDNIFITNPSWKNIGGIPGLLLTGQDNGLNHINIHCSGEFNNFIDTVKLFTYYPTLKISYPSVDESNVYRDNAMNVKYVHITTSPKHCDASVEDETSNTETETNVNGKRTVASKTEGENSVNAKRHKSSSQVISYICEIHPRPGKLLINKCIDLGIPPGPLCKMLKSGLDITKEDGTIVRSKDVCLPDSPRTSFIVTECPTEDYLDSFVNHSAFEKYQQAASISDDMYVHCILHFTPEEIFNNQRYQEWMRRFPATTQHIVLNDKNTCMGSEAVYKNQYLLNMLHSEIFPLLNKNKVVEHKTKEKDLLTYRAKAIQIINLRPIARGLQWLNVNKSKESYISETYKLPDFTTILNDMKVNIEKKSEELNLSNIENYPRIVMLGTGCSVPSKVRNTSGILLRINPETSIVLDCGEGTLGQIIRFYGVKEGDKILRTIKAIYVSHIHADHHLGLIGLLLRRKRLTNEKLYLLTPKCLTTWLNFYNDKFESISDQYIMINNSDIYLNYHKLSHLLEKTILNTLDIKAVNTTYVAHCKQSYGIAITLKDNKKIVYSGDTMFSKSLIELGQNCDLLIHEATMETGLEALAKSKLHSTTSEAITVGKFMNAKFTLLTHFSQRYSKIPYIPEKETNVGLAYDNMELKLPQLPLLPLFYPCMQLMFHEYSRIMMK